MTEIYLSSSTEETEEIGARLASSLLKDGNERAFIALFGEMGVGKTAFIRGFARMFGIASIKSPTYTVVNEYRSGSLPLYHFDLYRITDLDDLYSIGYDDYLDKKGIILTEWSEKIRSEIPHDAIFVTISKADTENARRIAVDHP